MALAPIHSPGDPIYLDHNATAPALPEVVDAMLPIAPSPRSRAKGAKRFIGGLLCADVFGVKRKSVRAFKVRASNS